MQYSRLSSTELYQNFSGGYQNVQIINEEDSAFVKCKPS